jgi:potassium voltage-gated channel Eag-related subfamily H protein 1/potassium voltage-gated channel Eag-related subfamily H protein 5
MVSRAHLLPIIEPDSTFYMTWQVLNSMLVLFFLFEIPFLTFFEVSNEPNSHIFWVLVAAMVIYTLDMLISLNTAVYIQGNCYVQFLGILESDRKRIASHYLRNGFLVDIIPIIILGLQFFNRMTYYVGLLFYLKIYEILKL